MGNKWVGPISYSYIDFVSQAKKHLEDAESKAKGIKEQAFEQGNKDGYRNGYEDGINKGIEIGKQQYKETLNNIISILKETVKFRDESYKRSEVNLVKLAMIIAKAIVHAELKVNQEVINSIVKQAMADVLNKKNICIRVNTTDLQHIDELKEEAMSSTDGIINVSFQADDSVSPGGCIIETDMGFIDGRIDNELREIEEILMNKVEEEISIWREVQNKEDRIQGTEDK